MATEIVGGGKCGRTDVALVPGPSGNVLFHVTLKIGTPAARVRALVTVEPFLGVHCFPVLFHLVIILGLIVAEGTFDLPNHVESPSCMATVIIHY